MSFFSCLILYPSLVLIPSSRYVPCRHMSSSDDFVRSTRFRIFSLARHLHLTISLITSDSSYHFLWLVHFIAPVPHVVFKTGRCSTLPLTPDHGWPTHVGRWAWLRTPTRGTIHLVVDIQQLPLRCPRYSAYDSSRKHVLDNGHARRQRR